MAASVIAVTRVLGKIFKISKYFCVRFLIKFQVLIYLSSNIFRFAKNFYFIINFPSQTRFYSEEAFLVSFFLFTEYIYFILQNHNVSWWKSSVLLIKYVKIKKRILLFINKESTSIPFLLICQFNKFIKDNKLNRSRLLVIQCGWWINVTRNHYTVCGAWFKIHIIIIFLPLNMWSYSQ